MPVADLRWVTHLTLLFIQTDLSKTRLKQVGLSESQDVMNELHGKTALVTGTTSGIGRAKAIAIAALGALAIVHRRNSERGEQVVKEIETAGGQARFVAADLSDLAEIAWLAEQARAALPARSDSLAAPRTAPPRTPWPP